ncbi:MAG: glycosyltransferase [Selenomonadaceae bacterium]|nr:glycosyltransferase [Selenomonadaceae bacterium]
MPRFSICIPVRNGAKYLAHTLRLCIEQQYFDDYEIVVSDNQSAEDIKGVADSFNNPKIKYVRTPEYIGMGANFDYALDNACGEYKLIVGADDGLSRYALYSLDKAIKITGERLIMWQRSEYYWPDHHNLQNKICMYSNLGQDLFCGEDTVKSYIRFFGGDPPHIYDSAVMSSELIKEVEEKTGRKLHESFLADLYQALISAMVAKRYVKLRLPLSLYAEHAGSASATIENSLTDEYISRRHSADEIEKLDARKISPRSFFKKQFHFFLQKYLILCQAMDLFPEKIDLTEKDINLKKVINLLMTEYAYRASISHKNEEYEKAIELIWDDIQEYGDESLIKWFDGRFLADRDDNRYISRTRNYIDSDEPRKYRFMMNCNNFNAYNIYDAMILWDKANLSKTIIDEYFRKFEYAWKRGKETTEIIRGKMPSGGRLGVYGAKLDGVRLVRLLRYFIEDFDFDIVLFDQSAKKEETKLSPFWWDYKVVSPEKLSREKIDLMTVSLYRYDAEAYRLIEASGCKAEVVKLYEPNEVNWLAVLSDAK